MAIQDLYGLADTVTLSQLATDRYILGLLEQVAFPRSETTMETNIETHLKKFTRARANYKDRKEMSRNVTPDSFDITTNPAGYISEHIQIDDARLNSRHFGESIFPQNNRAQRAATYMAQQMETLMHRKQAAIEYQISQVLRGLTVNLGPTQISWGRNSSLTTTLNGTDLWTNAASNPIGTLEDGNIRLQRISGMRGNFVIMGSKAWGNAYTNTKFANVLDNRRMMLGQIETRPMGPLMEWRGNINGIGDIYTYTAQTNTDASSTLTNLVPDNQVLMGNSAAGTIFYAPVPAIVNGRIQLEETRILMDVFNSDNPPASFLRLQSAPLVVPVNPNAYASITVTA